MNESVEEIIVPYFLELNGISASRGGISKDTEGLFCRIVIIKE